LRLGPGPEADLMGVQMKSLCKSRKRWWQAEYRGRILRFRDGEVVVDDALHFVTSLRTECADIIFLDPPFNLGKKYGERAPKDDRIAQDRYWAYMGKVLERSVPVLKPGGSLYLYHLPVWGIRLGAILDRTLTFRHWIAISMKNGFVRGDYLHPSHYGLLYYVKGEPQHFRRPKIPPPVCRHCGKTLRDYGGYKEFVSSGINLSDFWDDVTPVRHRKHKHGSSNELPLRMLSRVIEISGVRGGLVVDPFAGTGTTLEAARLAGMRFVACDRDRNCLKIIAQRLRSV
jgi:site-specific DNA-methyltransferase (adenine-specific)